jgi:predicted MPP superfamily phosphohydrolase
VKKRLFPILMFISVSLPLVHAGQFNFPLKPDSVRFAAIGDMGTGEKPQYEIAQQMINARRTFPFDFVIMLGDNIYGGSSSKDFQKKFETPYKPLLDAGVKFYASLGNHDNPNERLYTFFNMNGSSYYTFEKGNVRIFALDSNHMDANQITWLEQQLQECWKQGLEDLLLSSPALLDRQDPRFFR